VWLGDGRALALSPDGARVIVQTFNPATLTLLPTSVGHAVALNPHALKEYQWASWTPDGRSVVVAANEVGAASRLYVQDIAAPGAPLRAISPPGISYGWHAVRPDGSSVAAIGPDGRTYLYSLANDPPRAVSGLAGGDVPVGWDAAGQALFVRVPRQYPQTIYRVDVITGARTIARTLQPAAPAGITRLSPVVLTPDGRYYAYSYARDLTDVFVISGLK
jgi:hypothetical protein